MERQPSESTPGSWRRWKKDLQNAFFRNTPAFESTSSLGRDLPTRLVLDGIHAAVAKVETVADIDKIEALANITAPTDQVLPPSIPDEER